MSSIAQLPNSTPQLASSASTVATALAHPHAAATQTSSTSSKSAGPAAASGSETITANDFLTLLVAEMKNQDPTQPTDPNAYISQMVDVNSLQQLIGINQGVNALDTAAGAPAVPSTGAAS